MHCLCGPHRGCNILQSAFAANTVAVTAHVEASTVPIETATAHTVPEIDHADATTFDVVPVQPTQRL